MISLEKGGQSGTLTDVVTDRYTGRNDLQQHERGQSWLETLNSNNWANTIPVLQLVDSKKGPN